MVVQLESDSADDDVTPAKVAHLYPADCTNLMLTMKTMIQGFVSAPPGGLSSSNGLDGTDPDVLIRSRERQAKTYHVLGSL